MRPVIPPLRLPPVKAHGYPGWTSSAGLSSNAVVEHWGLPEHLVKPYLGRPDLPRGRYTHLRVMMATTLFHLREGTEPDKGPRSMQQGFADICAGGAARRAYLPELGTSPGHVATASAVASGVVPIYDGTRFVDVGEVILRSGGLCAFIEPTWVRRVHAFQNAPKFSSDPIRERFGGGEGVIPRFRPPTQNTSIDLHELKDLGWSDAVITTYLGCPELVCDQVPWWRVERAWMAALDHGGASIPMPPTYRERIALLLEGEIGVFAAPSRTVLYAGPSLKEGDAIRVRSTYDVDASFRRHVTKVVATCERGQLLDCKLDEVFDDGPEELRIRDDEELRNWVAAQH